MINIGITQQKRDNTAVLDHVSKDPKRQPEGHINDLYRRFSNQEQGFSNLSTQINELSKKVDDISKRANSLSILGHDLSDRLDKLENKLDIIISHLPKSDNIKTNE